MTRPHASSGGTADARAWDLFFEALDAEGAAAARVPTGAAIVAADASNRDELVRRYQGEGRTVVVVDEDGREQFHTPPQS